MVVLRVTFGSFFKKQFDFCNFATSREQIELDREIKIWEIGLAKILVPSFGNLLDNLSIPVALYEFKTFKIVNIFSGDFLENSNFKSLNLILSQ